MWLGIYAQEKYHSGFSYYDVTKTTVAGKTVTTGTTYPNIPLTFIPDSRNLSRGDNGNSVRSDGAAVVPSIWFRTNGFSPRLDDYIIDGATQYRVIGIDDYTRMPGVDVFYLELRRDQLAL
jgi:hypothetical protein